MSDHSIEVVLEAGAAIGESPTWSPAEAALYWIDVKKPALYRFHPGSGDQHEWPLPSDIGAFALEDDLSGAVVALRTGVFELNFASGRLALLAPPPFDPAFHRFNEGACDPTGRFWVGAMFDPLEPNVCVPIAASLHSFTKARGLRAEPDAAELHNGMALSADGRQFLLSHSQAGTIWVFDFDPQLAGQRRPRHRAPGQPANHVCFCRPEARHALHHKRRRQAERRAATGRTTCRRAVEAPG